MIRNALTLLVLSTLWVVAGCDRTDTGPAGLAEGLPRNESPDAAPGLRDEPAPPPGAVPGGQADRPIDRPAPPPSDPARSTPPPAEPSPSPEPAN